MTRTPFTAIRTLSMALHPYAQCTECPFQRGPNSDTLSDVKIHVADTGHTVDVTHETASVYKGKPRK